MIKGIFKYLILPLFLLSCTKHYVQQKQEFNHYSLKETSEKKQSADTILRYKLKVEKETGRIIATSADNITKEGDENSLGNFVCDALKHAGTIYYKNVKPDLIIVNRGGLRANLPKGDIRVSNIFELMPFENEMVLVNISGEKLLEALPLILEKKHSFLGFTMKIEKNKIVEVKLNGSEIDETRTYYIITSDYLANGGDNFTFLMKPLSLNNSGLKIRDVIINYCDSLSKNNKQIIPYTDGRLRVSK